MKKVRKNVLVEKMNSLIRCCPTIPPAIIKMVLIYPGGKKAFERYKKMRIKKLGTKYNQEIKDLETMSKKAWKKFEKKPGRARASNS